jgi:predicted HAD superfamily phosphohydrolase
LSIRKKGSARTCTFENVVFVEFKPTAPPKTEREEILELIQECRRSKEELRRLVDAISRAADPSGVRQALQPVQVQK